MAMTAHTSLIQAANVHRSSTLQSKGHIAAGGSERLLRLRTYARACVPIGSATEREGIARPPSIPFLSSMRADRVGDVLQRWPYWRRSHPRRLSQRRRHHLCTRPVKDGLDGGMLGKFIVCALGQCAEQELAMRCSARHLLSDSAIGPS
jgi:hypothetical protein